MDEYNYILQIRLSDEIKFRKKGPSKYPLAIMILIMTQSLVKINDNLVIKAA